MIPLHLTLSGFLSYRDAVDLDFTRFDLACISGSNGAGKSSLLDAITWVLFGQARKRDDSLINARSNTAEVRLVFAYESNLFRVQRTKSRDKTGVLELHIAQAQGGGQLTWEDMQRGLGAWRPLTERTLRETEERLQEILRLDYDTFVNASFFLQGKADQFTQQRPSDRKRILGSILGLDAWEVYRERAGSRRKLVEEKVAGIDGALREIAGEMAEEPARQANLARLHGELERISQERSTQEALLESIRRIAASLAEQARLLELLDQQCASAGLRLQDLKQRLQARLAEHQDYSQVLERAEEIEKAYADWQRKRQELEALDQVAMRFHAHEKRREEPRLEIQAERSRLETEQSGLTAQGYLAQAWQSEYEILQGQCLEKQQQAQVLEKQLAMRSQLEAELQGARQRHVDARVENTRLFDQMDDLKNRITHLSETEGAFCPVCGQPLSAADRETLIEALNSQGKEMGDRYRANQTLLRQANNVVQTYEEQLTQLSGMEPELRQRLQDLTRLQARQHTLADQLQAWHTRDRPRLQEIEMILEEGNFAQAARDRLAEIDRELILIGYDAAAHDAMRQGEMVGRKSETEIRALERARAALAPLSREIAGLQEQGDAQVHEAQRLEDQRCQMAEALADARLKAPDLVQAETAYYRLQEAENNLRIAVGSAQQKVLVLEDLRRRRQVLEAQRADLSRLVSQYHQLERAFGKDGIPALLIEQALPEIEARANLVLDRLSSGNMTVRFITQAAYKDKKRDDLRETLDIQISDGAGMRDYEMFSGGEAFRVNFAVRLALSEVLAQRAGARLQTLVIDEGFGSQDAEGRQRLIEAINLVRGDFSKILVITHIDELKDAFPNRVEVEKTERGSTLRIS